MTGRDWQAFDAELRYRASEIATELLGKPGQRGGKEWRWGRKGSLAVVVAGAKAGMWFDHEAGTGGGLVDLVARARGLSRREALDWTADRIGLASDAEPRRPANRVTRPAADIPETVSSAVPEPAQEEPASPTTRPKAISPAAAAAARATRIWEAAHPAPADHPYLRRKQVAPNGLRGDSFGNLIVPLRDVEGELHTIETITLTGEKRFLAGGAKAGHFCTIGGPVSTSRGFLICEGWATGASLHEATGLPVVAAMDAGNLVPVAVRLRQSHPDAVITIVADNDDKHGREINPGVTAATKAAVAIEARLAIPPVAGDANDLALEQGAHAADLAGVIPGAPKRRAPVAPPAAKRDPAQEIAHILGRAVPVAGTPAGEYLSGRGLTPPYAPDLLFHPDLTHWESKSGYPALIGVVRDRNGEAIGLHRTYLAEAADGRVGKADMAKPRMMLGRIAGGAVRLGNVTADTPLALSEGIESGLAAMAARPDLPVWATLSTSGLEQVDLPAEARRILILADHDASGAGLRAAETAARRLRSEGREVAIALPPREGDDFNDLLLREGPEAVARVLEAAGTAAPGETPGQIGQHRPLNYAASGTTLPVLRADEGDLARAVERVWSLLLAANRTPWLFRYAGLPTWVVPDDEGRPVAATLTEERLRHMLARLADWRRMTPKGELVPAPPPVAVVKSVLATPDPGLPVLFGIVNTPVFGRNGTLLTSPGYHPDARLLYVPAPGFEVPPIPMRPTPAEVAAARELICEDLFGDFPFVSPAERAHAVALLLLGFLRGMIDGPTPLHLIEKPTPGTGATLMVDAIATILTGSGASVMTEGRDDDEWRKRVTAKLRQIPAILLIDNLRLKLDSSAVAAALTAPFWEDRILGHSEMVRLPIRCLWIATGNNPEFSNEMARRLVRIRLDANVDRPWQRGGFRHPDLMTWVRANRARIVAACLTLCQAWIAAGRPRGGRVIGSYENWAQLVGGVLEVAGIDGFLGNLEEMMEASDSEGAAWAGFIGAWWDRYGTAEVGASDLLDLAIVADPKVPVGREGRTPDTAELGRGISRMRDRVFDVDGRKLQLKFSRTLRRSQRWVLAIAENPTPEFTSHTSQAGCEVCEAGCEVADVAPHTSKPLSKNEKTAACEVCEVSPRTLTHARAHAHAHAMERPENTSHTSHTSHAPMKTEGYRCEDGCEVHSAPSQDLTMPAWLREVGE